MTTTRATSLRHVRPVQPLRFPASEPEDEKMPESRRHMRLRTSLYAMLRSVFAPASTLGCDQFVYFDANDPRRKLAPDAFVKLGVPDHDFDAFLVWEEGTPEVAFEVLSPSDSPERWSFKEKLRRYQALGVRELVCFNVDAKAGRRLRVWDRIEHDLVERVVKDDQTPSVVLGLMMFVEAIDVDPIALRLSIDGRRVLSLDEKLAGAKAQLDAKSAQLDAKSAQLDAKSAQLDSVVAERDAALAKLAALERAAVKKASPKSARTTPRRPKGR